VNQRFPLLLATAAVALLVPIAVTVAEEAAKAEVKAEAKTEAEAKIPEGQKIFLDSGCTSCHSMKGQGIEKKKSATATAATEPTASTTPATPAAPAAGKPPDLSAAGLEHDKTWITKFLLKTETLHDKKHMKTWKGTDEQLATLTAWLADQKNAEAAGLKASSDKAVKKAEEATQEAKEAKDEAKEAKQDAEKAADKADEAKKEAERARDQSQGK
jgi:cbb3-type cytochrome oxidase cytochrome c subunit